MIIWNGLGFLVAVIVFVSSLVFNLVFNAWSGEAYWNDHSWPMALSLFLSAIVCWFLGLALRKRNAQIVIDKATGKEFVLDRSRHTLFFIPMHFWGPILAIGGVIVLVVDLLRRAFSRQLRRKKADVCGGSHFF